MNLIAGLLIALVFYGAAADLMKKYSRGFYLCFYALVLLMVVIYSRGYDQVMPAGLKFVTDLFHRGVMATATFIIVMYLGVIRKHSALTRRYMRIRGEMSIVACLMALTHNILFGIHYFVAFFDKDAFMPVQTRIAALISMTLIAMMIPLFVTSFGAVRRRMKGKSWKNLQRLAYPFYILLYVHVMVLFSMSPEKNRLSIIVYTVIYVAYVVLRLKKAILIHMQKKSAAQARLA